MTDSTMEILLGEVQKLEKEFHTGRDLVRGSVRKAMENLESDPTEESEKELLSVLLKAVAQQRDRKSIGKELFEKRAVIAMIEKTLANARKGETKRVGSS